MTRDIISPETGGPMQPTVKDLMVPLHEYATVSEEATLFEAVIALEKAQSEFDQNRYRHRAVLILDKNGNVIGKVSQLDILRALEPKYGEMGDHIPLTRFGYSSKFMSSLLEKFSLWETPILETCKKAMEQKVTAFMYVPSEGEYVEENSTLTDAIHHLVMGHHQSLLVTKDNKIVGILRLTDVFKEITQIVKDCFP
jgi:CBS domain-containing protein